MVKRLIYLISICMTIGLVLALWATDGFQSVAASHGKPLMPFVAGVLLLAASLELLLLTSRLSLCATSRSNLELWGRGSISGLMITLVWACLYFAHLLLKDVQLNYQPWLFAIGLAIALALGLMGLVEESFLRENLVALGYLTAVAGAVVFPRYHLLGQCIATAGISLVLTTALVTGRIKVSRRSMGSYVISRDEDPVEFWFVVILLCGLIGLIVLGPAFYPSILAQRR
jgi:hypothetical protein